MMLYAFKGFIYANYKINLYLIVKNIHPKSLSSFWGVLLNARIKFYFSSLEEFLRIKKSTK